MSGRKTQKVVVDFKELKQVKVLQAKLEDRKQQVRRLKNIIRELEKEKEKLIEELKAYKAGVEYKPKDISRPKKLTPEERKSRKEQEKNKEKTEFLKKMKEKFGRKNGQ